MCFPNVTLAQCSVDGYTVVYINGINTSYGDANSDTNIFELKYDGISRLPKPKVSFVLGYNQTHGKYIDLGKAGLQAYEQNVLEDFNLQSILADLHEGIQTRRVLLVGHSQGTFYANAVYDFLISHGMEPSAVAVYNVATPAAYVEGGGAYLTSSNDRAINHARSVETDSGSLVALPANITLEVPKEEENDQEAGGHYFSSDYLALADHRIVQDMGFELQFLKTQKIDSTGPCFDLPSFNKSTPVINTIGVSIKTAGILAVTNAANGVTQVASAATSLATAATSKVASLASALYGVVTSVFIGGGAAVAQTQSTPAIASVVPATTPTPTAVTPAPQPSAPKVAVVERPAATHTPPPTPTPTQAQAPTPPPAQTPTEPLVPTAPLLTLPVGVSPGFGGGGEPKHDPPPESPPPETLPPEASHLLSMIFPKDNQLFSTSSVTASGTTTPTTTVTVIWGPTNSSDITVATTTSDEEGVWLIDLTLTEGEIALMAGAYDPTTDATSTDSRVITIDTTPPEAPVISSADCTNSDGLCLTASSTLDITWSDVPDALSYAIDQNGEESTTTTTSFTLTLPPDGATSTIAVAAIDQAGNVATSTALSAVYVASSTVALTSFPDLPFIPAGMVTGLTLDWSVYGVMPNSCTLAEIEPQDAQPWSVALEHAGAGSGSITAPDIAEPSSSELQATTTFMLSCTALDGTTVQVNKSILDMIMTMEI